MRSHDRWLLGGPLIVVIAVAAGGYGDAGQEREDAHAVSEWRS
jgi:hypothetical protein